jgi:hypothetical protein
MSNLLKEAIADAKAVRATALANAKAALEEAFQPKLEAMLAEKLKNEISDGEYGSDESSETMPMDMSASDDAMDERMQISDAELNEILAELEDELDEAGQVDPNVPVAPVPAPVDPMAQAPAPVAPAPVAPAPVDPMAVAPAPVDPMAQAPAPFDPMAQAPAPVAPAPVAEDTGEDEMVDLQELLDSLNDDESAGEEITEGEEEDEDEDEEVVDEKIEDEKVAESLQFELNEAMSTVQYLRDQLNEVNLLNAKLLYTNKLFNTFNLDQKQKLKVVETFDLAKSIREVKLSYTILSESYSLGGSVVKKTNTTAKTITEGLASKPVASTAPKKELIVENSNVMALRFQKLAGIKK